MPSVFRFCALIAVCMVVACTSVTPEGSRVTILSSADEIVGCETLGTVSSGMKATQNSAYDTLRNQAAARGADVMLIESYGEATGSGSARIFRCDSTKQASARAVQAAEHADLEKRATQKVMCESGTDCEYKWGRAVQWLQNNSAWKFRNVADNLLTTEGPMSGPRAAFEVTRIPIGDGKTYQIALRAWCGQERCIPSILTLRASFVDFVGKAP